jgi:hypothetical protein
VGNREWEYPMTNNQCPNARLNLEIGNWKLAIGNSLWGRVEGVSAVKSDNYKSSLCAFVS